jgi:hypothetical protein
LLLLLPPIYVTGWYLTTSYNRSKERSSGGDILIVWLTGQEDWSFNKLMLSVWVLVAKEERWLVGGSKAVGGAGQDGCLSGWMFVGTPNRNQLAYNSFTLPVGPHYDRYDQVPSAEQQSTQSRTKTTLIAPL